MRFGIDLPNYGDFGDPRLLLELAVEAEAAGWDGFFLWDHLLDDRGSPTTDPWVVLSAVATKTQRIRFGPMVTPLPRRRMTKLARETVALDHLSGGRFILGIGLGSHDEREFADLGDEGDRRIRGQILDESLDVLDSLWSGQPVQYSGSHLSVDAPPFLPRPVQQPRIPIWVAGSWPNRKPMRRAAQWDGAFPIGRDVPFDSQLSPETMAEALAFVSDVRDGDAPIDLVHAGLTSGDRPADVELARRYSDVGVTWWLEHVYPDRMAPSGVRELIQKGPPR